MYQPYPATKDQPRSGPPSSILMAMKVMYVGAALSAVATILTLVTTGSLREAIHKAHPLLSAARVDKLEQFDVVAAVVVGVVGIGLWLWMAVANKEGNGWARITASLLFALNTVATLVVVFRPGAAPAKGATIVIWLAGLAVVILLWQRDSSNYYESSGRVT
jgi:hypothetical protein